MSNNGGICPRISSVEPWRSFAVSTRDRTSALGDRRGTRSSPTIVAVTPTWRFIVVAIELAGHCSGANVATLVNKVDGPSIAWIGRLARSAIDRAPRCGISICT